MGLWSWQVTEGRRECMHALILEGYSHHTTCTQQRGSRPSLHLDEYKNYPALTRHGHLRSADVLQETPRVDLVGLVRPLAQHEPSGS